MMSALLAVSAWMVRPPGSAPPPPPPTAAPANGLAVAAVGWDEAADAGVAVTRETRVTPWVRRFELRRTS